MTVIRLVRLRNSIVRHCACRRGFTLAELLLVVAMVSLLVVLAMPHLLEAQTRSKVSRVKTDLHTLSSGLELYAVDQNNYPDAGHFKHKAGLPYSAYCLQRLSTPVAYLQHAALGDPFSHQYPLVYANIRAELEGSPSVIDLVIPGLSDGQKALLARHEYAVASVGPDGVSHAEEHGDQVMFNFDTLEMNVEPRYDSTNGTISSGDIYRTGRGQM